MRALNLEILEPFSIITNVYRLRPNTKKNKFNPHSTSLFQTYQTKLKNTSSTAQGGGGSFKNRKTIGEVGCCESRMAERSH
jgi:hypothetical protein